MSETFAGAPEIFPAGGHKLTKPKVWVFFYGAYMNFDLLNEVSFVPEQYEVATWIGSDVRIKSLANQGR